MRSALLEADPQGLVEGLKAHWSGPIDQPRQYRLQARVRGLAVAAEPAADPTHLGRPGISGADLELDANETGGEGRISLKDGHLQLPGVFEDPLLPLAHFSSQVVWQVHAHGDGAPAGLEVLLKNARLANDDLQTEFQARWQTGPGTGLGRGGRFPGQLELGGRLTGLAAPRLVRYLPAVLDDTRSYLSRALLAGRIRQLNYKLRGDLWAFPFAHPQDGEFRATAQVDGVDLAYVPALEGGKPVWPALTQISGEVVMDRSRLSFRNAQGRLWGLELKGVNGQIPDLLHQATLNIEGAARGPLSDGLRFVAESPVGGWIGHALEPAVASGGAELRLGLNIPLLHADQTSVKGVLTLAGNDLRLRPDAPALGQTRGRVEFSQRSFSVTGATARLLGGEASFDGAMQPDGSVRFQGQGVASAEGLRAAPELGLLSRLAQDLSGQAAYRLQLGVVQGQVEIQVTSPLVGLASHLPEPLAKPAEASWPLRYQTTLAGEPGVDAPPRDLLRLELGHQLKAEFLRDLSGVEPQVLRGALAIGQPLPATQPGLVVGALDLGQVNLDAWQAVAARLGKGAMADGQHSSYEPTDLDLQARELTLSGRKLTRLSAQLRRRAVPEGELWRIRLHSEQVQGQADYLPATATPGSGRLHARLARLAVPQSDAEAVDSLFDQASNRVPALDIVVDDFELRGKKLGRLEVEAAYLGSAGRDWRLSKLNLTAADAQFTGSGQWTTGAHRRMALNFRLDVKDGGDMLERLGMGRVVRGVTGNIQGALAWNGSPLSPEWSQMTGQMQLALDRGQFLKVQPGAARLLGVLSLQSLPRRFLLDFRDLFQEGFAFDSVTGSVRLADGLARTGNLRIRGVQAVVLMEGQANLRQETQDLHVYVVPELNAGTASLAYATINPVIGLGTFLAQLFLRNPLREAGTREFRIDGSWSDPVVTDLERHGDVPLPAVDAPASQVLP